MDLLRGRDDDRRRRMLGLWRKHHSYCSMNHRVFRSLISLSTPTCVCVVCVEILRLKLGWRSITRRFQ